MLIWSIAVHADGFDEGRALADAHRDDVKNAIKNLDNESLKNIFDGFSDSPSESHFYEGTDQQYSNIKDEAAQKAANDETAHDMNDASKNKNKVDQNFIDEAIQGSEVIQNQASEILGDISKDLVDCSKPTVCRTEYFEKVCLSSPKEIINYCHQVLNVREVQHQSITHYPLTIHIDAKEHGYAGANIELTTGRILWSGPHEAHFILYGRLPGNISCSNSVIGSLGSISSAYPATRIDNIRYPSCNNLTMDIHVEGAKKVSININIDIAVGTITKEYIDEWNNDECATLDKFLHCEKKSEVCTIETETHEINKTPITRTCWKKEVGFLCKDLNDDQHGCDALIKSGCQQKNAKCVEEAYGNCQSYAYTYDCPVTRCIETSDICSHQGNCIDGNCINNARKPDPDFGESVSKLSAAFDAANNFNGDLIFAGTAKECNRYPLNTVNCCSDKGWLKDISSLFNCGQEAIDLGKAKETGLAHYVGSHETSLKETKVYCVFPSKLARIVQEQGRGDQLGISFGDYKNPNCSGLTPDELQRIDFGKIDFSEFVADIQNKKNIPDEGKLNQKIQEKLKVWAEQGKSHETN